MNLWQVLLMGAMAVPVPLTPNSQMTAPPTTQTTWHCMATSPGGEADIEVDIHGNGDHGEVTWNANVGKDFSVHATVFGYFSKAKPEIIHGHMLFLNPDLSSKQAHEALHHRKFQWVISTQSGLSDHYPNWHSGIPAFSGGFTKFDPKENDHPSLQFDPDDFLRRLVEVINFFCWQSTKEAQFYCAQSFC